MRYVNDSTIYGGYYSSVHHVIEPFYPQICMFTKDLEILGRVTITDDKSVGHKYMLTYDNGGILYISSHLNPTETERTIIKKYSREDFLKFPLSVKDIPTEEIESLVYPNPTARELNIDIRGICSDRENRIRIIDINGRTMISRIIRGSGNVLSIDVSMFDAGTYIYEIFNDEGVTARGKFVKK